MHLFEDILTCIIDSLIVNLQLIALQVVLEQGFLNNYILFIEYVTASLCFVVLQNTLALYMAVLNSQVTSRK